jgi:hypothetical protein
MFSGELKALMEKTGKSHHKGNEIKIALIDDGVDICEKTFRDRIIHGNSLGYYWDGVHIISMSWTVNEPQNELKTKFDEALSNASQKGNIDVLLFSRRR